MSAVGWLLLLVSSAALWTALRRQARRLELVARAEHELRGPLTTARLALDSAARDGDDRRVLAAVDRELGRATLAIADLAAAREGRRASAHAEVVDVADVVIEAAPAWRVLAQRFGAELRLTVDGRTLERAAVDRAVGDTAGADWPARPLARIDPLRLAQAAGNLIANAAEHGGGAPIAVRVVVVAGHARVEVADEGPGLRRPLSAVARGASAGRGRRGRGLVVALTAIAEAGGTIRTLPSLRGTRLAIELPLAGTGGLASEPADDPPCANGGATLVADPTVDSAPLGEAVP